MAFDRAALRYIYEVANASSEQQATADPNDESSPSPDEPVPRALDPVLSRLEAEFTELGRSGSD